jgi:hypothetical protein
MIYLANALSLSMLPSCIVTLRAYPITPERASRMLLEAEEWSSCVGHEDTARIYSQILAVDVPARRVSVQLDAWDMVVVGQYSGPRLPEGATRLPEGARIDWWLVVVEGGP